MGPATGGNFIFTAHFFRDIREGGNPGDKALLLLLPHSEKRTGINPRGTSGIKLQLFSLSQSLSAKGDSLHTHIVCTHSSRIMSVPPPPLPSISPSSSSPSHMPPPPPRMKIKISLPTQRVPREGHNTHTPNNDSAACVF